MSQDQCMYDKQCSYPHCRYDHSYTFQLPEYTIPKRKENTILLPCHRPNWLYIQRALNTIETMEDFQRYFKSVVKDSNVYVLASLTPEEQREFITDIFHSLSHLASGYGCPSAARIIGDHNLESLIQHTCDERRLAQS